AAVGQAADHLVLGGDELAGAELGLKRERRSALAAEARRPPRCSVAAAPDRLVAARAEAPALGDHRRVAEGGGGRVAVRDGRDLDQPGPESPARGAPRAAGGRAPRRAGGGFGE